MSRRFDPRSVSGLVSWLRSDALITLASGKVSAWGDLSPIATNGVSQATAAQQPTYAASGGANGLPYLDCGVGSIGNRLDFPTSAFTALTAAEMFFVGSNNIFPTTSVGDGGKFQLGIHDGTSDTHLPYAYAGGTIYCEFGTNVRKGAIVSMTPYAANATYVFNAASMSGSWFANVNGARVLTTAVNTVQFDPTQWLCTSQTATYYHFGKFYEFIVFNRVLSTSERALVNAYVYARYGIAGA